jgi:hypothetical protein
LKKGAGSSALLRLTRSAQMGATPDSTLADPEQLIDDLQRQLAECGAERDEAFQRETATAEVLQVINSSPDNPGSCRLSRRQAQTRQV